LRDGTAQYLFRNKGVAPHRLHQLALSHQASPILNQEDEKRQRLRLNRKGAPSPEQAEAPEIDLYVLESVEAGHQENLKVPLSNQRSGCVRRG
jgi:hypothetical protein